MPQIETAQSMPATDDVARAPIIFPRDLMPLLRCPRDAGAFSIEEVFGTASGIVEAALQCDTCAARYRIHNGIARLMDGDLTPENEHEIGIRDAEYSGMQDDFVPPDCGWRSELSDRMEIPQHLDPLQPLENRTVLEIGCGDGRFTILMAQRGARVVAVDFSLGALDRLGHRLLTGVAPTTYTAGTRDTRHSLRGRVGLVQAHAGKLHLAPRTFDRALSATPLDCRDERLALYASIAEALADDGTFVGSVEHDDLARRALGLPGVRRYSDGGILIEHFDRDTMRREVAPFFGEIHIRPIRPTDHVIRHLPLGLAVQIARAITWLPGMRNLGEILLMRARRPLRQAEEGLRRPGIRAVQSFYRWYARRKGNPAVWGSEQV